jgi:hypothetical protein
MASYRQRGKRENALTLVGGSRPEVQIRRLVVRESRAFRGAVEALDVGPDVRGLMLHSMDFLREFYERSDFDRGPAW